MNIENKEILEDIQKRKESLATFLDVSTYPKKFLKLPLCLTKLF